MPHYRQQGLDLATLTVHQLAALHWAAVSLALREMAERDGRLTSTRRDAYNRYEQAAQAHGFTDADIRSYRDQTALAA
ncbi:hypothetical protein [Streptomyces sp. DB-54]